MESVCFGSVLSRVFFLDLGVLRSFFRDVSYGSRVKRVRGLFFEDLG